MSKLELIQEPIADQLQEFDRYVRERFVSETPLMGEMLQTALSSRGKGIRPMLTMLCCALHSADNSINERGYIASMMGEMIHLASLIHDDVLDNSPVRRGKPTLNEMWQSRNAVLTGDYILGRTLRLGLESGFYDIVTHLSDTISTLCEGEVMQAHHATTMTLTMEEYLKIVEKKTASLLSACCGAGAMAAGACSADIERIEHFGRAVGIAFQMQDDILDFDPTAQSGKEQFNDLKEGKITLPMLQYLERLNPDAQVDTITLMGRCATCESTCKSLACSIIKSGALDTSRQTMMGYIHEAETILLQYPPSPIRESLHQLLHFIHTREV